MKPYDLCIARPWICLSKEDNSYVRYGQNINDGYIISVELYQDDQYQWFNCTDNCLDYGCKQFPFNTLEAAMLAADQFLIDIGYTLLNERTECMI